MKWKMQLRCHIVPSHTTLCTFSNIFFITAVQKTRIITRKDTEADNRTTRGTEWLLHEETLNRLYGSTDHRELLSYLLQSVQT